MMVLQYKHLDKNSHSYHHIDTSEDTFGALLVDEAHRITLEDIDYDVKVFDDPNELRKARMVAGYCWEWASCSGRKKKRKNRYGHHHS